MKFNCNSCNYSTDNQANFNKHKKTKKTDFIVSINFYCKSGSWLHVKSDKLFARKEL